MKSRRRGRTDDHDFLEETTATEPTAFTSTTAASDDAFGNEAAEQYESKESVSQTVRTYFPETWLWDVVIIECVDMRVSVIQV